MPYKRRKTNPKEKLCEKCKCDSCKEKEKKLVILEKNNDIVIDYEMDDSSQLKEDYPNTAYFFSP